MTILPKIFLATIAVTLISCGSDPMQELRVEIPQGATIWSPITKIQAQGRTDEEVSLIVLLDGSSSNVKAFYDKNYNDWETLTEWSTGGHDRVESGEWKSWKRGDKYFVAIVSPKQGTEIKLTHFFSNERAYNWKLDK